MDTPGREGFGLSAFAYLPKITGLIQKLLNSHCLLIWHPIPSWKISNIGLLTTITLHHVHLCIIIESAFEADAVLQW